MSQKNLIFLHIPKTAGTTFKNFLRNSFQEDEVKTVTWSSWFKGVNDILVNPPPHKQSHNKIYRLVMGHQPFGNHSYLKGEWYYLTFLRDPTQRTLSHYYYLTKDSTYNKLSKIYLNKHVMWRNIPYYYLFDNFQTRFLSNNIFGVQYEAMSSMLSVAIYNLNQIHVGLTENFTTSLEYFSHQFLLRRDTFENGNVSNRPDIKSADNSILDLVQSHNKYDNLLYEYAKIKFQEQTLSGMSS